MTIVHRHPRCCIGRLHQGCSLSHWPWPCWSLFHRHRTIAQPRLIFWSGRSLSEMDSAASADGRLTRGTATGNAHTFRSRTSHNMVPATPPG
jgi:hypothetical protein